MDTSQTSAAVEMDSLTQLYPGSLSGASLDSPSSRRASGSSPDEGSRDQIQGNSINSDDDTLLPKQPSGYVHKLDNTVDDNEKEPAKLAINEKPEVTLLYCLPHALPFTVTIVILYLNIRGVYWQDLGHPSQSSILQAFQYAAKAHEITMAASLAAIAVHRIQHALTSSGGLPFGSLVAGLQCDSPSIAFTKAFLGGATASSNERVNPYFFPLTGLILAVSILSQVVGPSSAVAMIPRLNWWDVSRAKAFGTEYTDRLYFNRTEKELWPAEISNAIFADQTECTSGSNDQDCAVSAMDVVRAWTVLHQNQGTKPNLTVFQDSEVTRILTSEAGPPDDSSWTVTSTVGSVFTRDLNHYWDWLVENSTLPMNIRRPLLRPSSSSQNLKIQKPLVQVQCHTYLDPDFDHDNFEFPHDQLVTPPLDKYKSDTWTLPNEFVANLLGDDPSIGNPNDTSHSPLLFSW